MSDLPQGAIFAISDEPAQAQTPFDSHRLRTIGETKEGTSDYHTHHAQSAPSTKREMNRTRHSEKRPRPGPVANIEIAKDYSHISPKKGNVDMLSPEMNATTIEYNTHEDETPESELTQTQLYYRTLATPQ